MRCSVLDFVVLVVVLVFFLIFLLFFDKHTSYLIPKPVLVLEPLVSVFKRPSSYLKPKPILSVNTKYHSILMWNYVPVVSSKLSSKTGGKGSRSLHKTMHLL